MSHDLLVYGSCHFSDSASHLYAELCEEFEQFAPNLLLTETIRQIRPSTSSDMRDEYLAAMRATTRESAVRMSECNLGVKLALEASIRVVGLEPSLADQIRHLATLNFSVDDILLFYVASTLSVSHLYSATMTPSELANYRLNMFRRETDLPSSSLTLSSVERRCRELFGVFPLDDPAWFAPRVDPLRRANHPEYCVLNSICSEDTLYRDKYFVAEIARATFAEPRVFVLYGASHAYMHEPALRNFFEKAYGACR